MLVLVIVDKYRLRQELFSCGTIEYNSGPDYALYGPGAL